MLLTSLLIAVPRTVLALVLATVFAWCIARTNTPCKRVLEGLLVFMFFLPELPWVLAWMLLGAPNVGLLNQWLRAIVPGGEGLINVYSYGGLIVLGAVRSAPVLFLFVHPAFLAMDATLGGGRAHGRRQRMAHDVADQLPAADAGAAGVGHPVVRGGHGIVRDPASCWARPANIFVFTTRIYDLAYGGHVANFGAAMVLALILLVLTEPRSWCSGGSCAAAPTRPCPVAASRRAHSTSAWRWVAFAADHRILRRFRRTAALSCCC